MTGTNAGKGHRPLQGMPGRKAHLEDDTIAGGDKTLNDEQPLPAPQMPQAIHVQQPSSQRRPYDLRHTETMRPEPPALDWTNLMGCSCPTQDVCHLVHTGTTNSQPSDFLAQDAVSEVDWRYICACQSGQTQGDVQGWGKAHSTH